MGGLQDGECPTKFVLEGVDEFGSYDPFDLNDGIFLGNGYFECSIFQQF